MKRVLLVIAAALVVSACDTSVAFNADGFKCDPGDVCPDGLSCVDGVCRSDSSNSGGGAGGGVGGGPGGGVGGGAGTDGGDLCAGVTCTTPPANSCPDANTLRTYGTTGVCLATGQCDYAPTDSVCAAGCSSGTCPNSLCIGVTCTTPPANSCDDVNTLRTFGASGSCEPTTGACSYTGTTSSCPNGCGGGACLVAPYTFAQTLPNVRSRVTAVDQVPASTGDHVLAVGPAGYVAKWNGSSWSTLASGTTKNLNAVWLFLDTNNAVRGYIVGDSGTVLQYDGTTLSPVTVSGLTANLVTVHGTDEDSVIAGGGTQIAIKNNTGWFTVSPGTGNTFNSVKSVVGENGVLRASGRCTEPDALIPTATVVGPCVVGWTSAAGMLAIDIDTAAPTGVTEYVAIGPDAENNNETYQYVSVGKTTRRYNYNGGANAAAFDTQNAVTINEGSGIVAISRGETGLTGATYFLSQTNTSSFGAITRATKSGNNPPFPVKLQDIFNTGAMSRNDSGGVIVADSISESASIGRRGPATGLTGEFYDVGEHWVSAAQAAATGYTGLILVSAFGDVASRLNTAPNIWRIARNMPGPTAPVVRDAAGGGPVAMVGEGGAVLRWSSVTNSVTALTSPTTQRLNAICQATATQFYAVGNAGTVLSIVSNGASFTTTSMTSPTPQNLNEVICSGTNGIAVGDNGTVLRLSGSSWVANTPAFPSSANLNAVTVASGTLFVASASTFAKLEGTTWTTTLAARAGVAELQARNAFEIYGIAADTVVRFNGTAWSNVITATSGLVGSVSGTGRIVYVGSDGAVVEGQ